MKLNKSFLKYFQRPKLPVFVVHFVKIGRIKQSYVAREINMADTKKAVRDAADILKFPMDLSIVDACSTENVTSCAYAVQNRIVVVQIGNNLITIFTSSTFVTEETRHGF